MYNVVLAPYFTKACDYSQHDSSNGGKGGCKANDYGLIKGWYDSVKRLGLHARVFHNELSKEFIRKHETDEIKFVYWPGTTRPSYNDERFYAYQSFLMANEDVDRVLCTDLFDVEILMNPFELMNEMDNVHESVHLFSGSEIINTYSSAWLLEKCKMMHYPSARENYRVGRTVFNAGIIGGKRKWVLELFNLMINEMSDISKKHNSNMLVYNRCVERLMKGRHWKVFHGYPLHNVFNSFTADNGTYIRHK